MIGRRLLDGCGAMVAVQCRVACVCGGIHVVQYHDQWKWSMSGDIVVHRSESVWWQSIKLTSQVAFSD